MEKRRSKRPVSRGRLLVTITAYLPFSGRVTLTRADGYFCGGVTDVAACTACLTEQRLGAVDIARWRDRHAALLAGASFVIAPSRFAADLLRRYFPATDPVVIAHGLPAREPRRSGARQAVRSAVASLVRVGLDDVRGYLMGGIETWVRAGYPLAQTPQVSASALAALLDRGDTLRILDVRDPAEWREGHARGAIRVRCGELSKRLDEIPHDGGPIAVVCAAGYRSTVAASVLERAGFSSVINVTGGMNAWKQAGLPLAII